MRDKGDVFSCYTGIIEQKPQKSTTKLAATRSVYGDSNWRFHGRSSSVVARTPPKTKNGRFQVAEQSLDTWNIRIHTVVFKLSLSEIEERKNERKKAEQNQNFHAWFSRT